MSSVFAFKERTARPGSSLPKTAAAVRALAWPLLIALAVLAAALLFARFAAIPFLAIRHVVVESDLPLSEEELLKISGLQGNEHWNTVSTSAIARRLEANPLVREARVRKAFPGTLRVTIKRREAAALVLAERGGRSFPVLVDGEGFVFKVGDAAAELDLPVVSGLSVGETALGARLGRGYAPLFAELRSLREKSPSLYRLLSEVRVLLTAAGAEAPAAPPSYDLLVYLTSSRVPFRARGAVDAPLLKSALMVIDLLSNQGVLKDIQELDFRGEEVVYRMKEG
jgi:cell division protein FtsQ